MTERIKECLLIILSTVGMKQRKGKVRMERKGRRKKESITERSSRRERRKENEQQDTEEKDE